MSIPCMCHSTQQLLSFHGGKYYVFLVFLLPNLIVLPVFVPSEVFLFHALITICLRSVCACLFQLLTPTCIFLFSNLRCIPFLH